MNRRRTLFGLATIVLGASGFVASGAVTLGSEGSLGDNWVQVEGINQAIDLSPVQTDTGEQGSEGGDGSIGTDPGTQNSDGGGETGGGGGDDDDSTGGGGGDDGDEPVTTRVQVVTDPNNPGNAVNTGGSASWNGKIIDSEAIHETPDGFLGGITAENINSNAIFTIGELQGKYPGEQVAFIIANVGSDKNGSQSISADISATLFADEETLETDQLRFSYKIINRNGTTTARGENLFSTESVRLGEGEIIEIVVVIDTRNGDSDLEKLDMIQFTATGVNN